MRVVVIHLFSFLHSGVLAHGLGYGISRQRDWKKMMDGDVSHSSELKLLTLGVEVVAEVVCTIVFLFLLLHCYVYKPCVYFSFFSPFFS
jgi:hypothetical protein